MTKFLGEIGAKHGGYAAEPVRLAGGAPKIYSGEKANNQQFGPVTLHAINIILPDGRSLLDVLTANGALD